MVYVQAYIHPMMLGRRLRGLLLAYEDDTFRLSIGRIALGRGLLSLPRTASETLSTGFEGSTGVLTCFFSTEAFTGFLVAFFLATFFTAFFAVMLSCLGVEL